MSGKKITVTVNYSVREYQSVELTLPAGTDVNEETLAEAIMAEYPSFGEDSEIQVDDWSEDES
jgi:hypothetical protein